MTDDIEQAKSRVRQPLWEESRSFPILLTGAAVFAGVVGGYFGYTAARQQRFLPEIIIFAPGPTQVLPAVP